MEIKCAKCGRVAMVMQEVTDDEFEKIVRVGPYCPTCERWLGEEGEEIK